MIVFPGVIMLWKLVCPAVKCDTCTSGILSFSFKFWPIRMTLKSTFFKVFIIWSSISKVFHSWLKWMRLVEHFEILGGKALCKCKYCKFKKHIMGILFLVFVHIGLFTLVYRYQPKDLLFVNCLVLSSYLSFHCVLLQVG